MEEIKSPIPYRIKHGHVIELKKGIDYDGILFNSEICICAAMKMPDGYIIRGHRHNNCIDLARVIPRYKDIDFSKHDFVQGFVTSTNRFVDRGEGRRLQEEAGIKSADKEGYLSKRILYSEDLY